MTLKQLRDLLNIYPLHDDDTEFEIYNSAGEIITEPIDIHEDERLCGDRILTFG